MVVRFQPITNIFDEIDSIFNPVAVPFPAIRWTNRDRRFADISVKESGEQVHVYAELPGVAKEDVNVNINEGTLVISAERKQPELKENEQWIRNEVNYGKIERTVQLPYPADVEKVSATHEQGILHIVLPKHENAKPKQISIR
ncbi:MAG: Hsp20/alpha crystallin family protein [Bacteroidota bacterium]